jgi:hypothetical protein
MNIDDDEYYDRDYDHDPLAFFQGLLWALLFSAVLGGILLLAYLCDRA